MANTSKNKNDNNTLKAFKLKMVDCNFDIETLMDEYVNYYNKVSNWLCANLGNKVGDVLLPHLKDTTTKYYIDCTEKADNTLAQYIMDGNAKFIQNSIFNVIDILKIDEYCGNIANFGSTYFRKWGYVKEVCANYQASLENLKPKIRKRTINKESDLEVLIEQCCYEISKDESDKKDKNNLKKLSAWKEKYDFYVNKAQCNENTQLRMELLYNTFKNHSDEVLLKYDELLNERLCNYNGCIRKSKSCKLEFNKFECTPIDEFYGYEIVFKDKKKDNNKKIQVMGNRQLVTFKNNERVELTNITTKHSYTVIIKKEGDSYFICLSCYVDFKKEEREIKKVVGVDVNTKHCLLSTSIKDEGNVVGYVNIYKELLADNDFSSLISTNKQYTEIYNALAESVNFCPIEVPFLYTRMKNTDYEYKQDKIEKAISNVLDNLQKKYQNVDTKKRNYIAFVKMLRSKLVSYFRVYKKYMQLQKEYDLTQNYVDKSTESKETMDKRRWENPFKNTPQCQELLAKLNNIETDLVGCRNNIIQYAMDVFIANGYDTINLENLTSSSFERARKPFPTTTSLLKYHKWEGKSIDEVKKTQLYQDKHENYIIIGDSVVEDIIYTEKGEYDINTSLFYNIIIKRVHFADIKDRFLLLSNNTNMNVCLIAPFYTSQIDSVDHKIYVEADGKKCKVVEKTKVRNNQERFINELNADYNAACNIAYPSINEEWRKLMFSDKAVAKYEYSTPTLLCTIKTREGMLNRIKKIGATKVLDEAKTNFSHKKSLATANK